MENLVAEMKAHARKMMEIQGWNPSNSEYGRLFWCAAKSFLWLKVDGDMEKFREVLEFADDMAYWEADSKAAARHELNYT